MGSTYRNARQDYFDENRNTRKELLNKYSIKQVKHKQKYAQDLLDEDEYYDFDEDLDYNTTSKQSKLR